MKSSPWVSSIRSPLGCSLGHGICVHLCYFLNVGVTSYNLEETLTWRGSFQVWGPRLDGWRLGVFRMPVRGSPHSKLCIDNGKHNLRGKTVKKFYDRFRSRPGGGGRGGRALPISGTTIQVCFNETHKHGLRPFFIESVSRPLCIARHTRLCPCICVLPTHAASWGPWMGMCHLQKPSKGSEMETQELLGGMEESRVSLMRGQ